MLWFGFLDCYWTDCGSEFCLYIRSGHYPFLCAVSLHLTHHNFLPFLDYAKLFFITLCVGLSHLPQLKMFMFAVAHNLQLSWTSTLWGLFQVPSPASHFWTLPRGSKGTWSKTLGCCSQTCWLLLYKISLVLCAKGDVFPNVFDFFHWAFCHPTPLLI